MTIRHTTGSVLRCGICFRDLTKDPARGMHVVFPDGSMRCSAPEALERTPEGDPYLSTHVVLDSFTRRVALERAFARHILNVPAEVES
jgi:hypothetical protein